MDKQETSKQEMSEQILESLDVFGPEELCFELEVFVETIGHGMQALRHPLVYIVPYSPEMNKIANRTLNAKREQLEKAAQDREWGHYLVLVERPYRLTMLSDIADNMTDAEYWHNLAWVYTDSENLHEEYDKWAAMLSAPRSERECLMSDDERAALEAMPDQIVIYRGVGRQEDCGLSWTLKLSTAQWFAARFAPKPEREHAGFIMRAKVDKENVIAFFSARNEAEIVVLPEHIKDLTVEKSR